MKLRFLQQGIDSAVELLSQFMALWGIKDLLSDSCLGFWLSMG